MEEGSGTGLRSPKEMTKRQGTNPKECGDKIMEPWEVEPYIAES